MFFKIVKISATLCLLSLFSMSATAGFSVKNGKLVEGNNVPFVMRGINHPHVWYRDKTYDALKNIANTGANSVRIVLSDGFGYMGSRVNGAELAQVIQWCKENKLIAILEVHDATGYWDNPTAENPETIVNYWLSSDVRAAIDGQEDYVIINIANEPFGNNITANWTNVQKLSIGRLRAAQLKHTLMVDGPNWGQDWSRVMINNAQSVFEADSHRNLVFSVHMYGSYGDWNSVNNYLSGFRAKGLPLVIGEFADTHDGSRVDVDAITSLAQQTGIGYLGWSWSGNSGIHQPLDICFGFNPNNLSGWGNRLINGTNGIRQTSQRAYIYRITSSLAAGKAVTASSIEGPGFEPEKAEDVNINTRWSAALNAPTATYSVDLGAVFNISGLKFFWEAAYARAYSIEVSNDGFNYSTLFSTTTGTGGEDYINAQGQGRYVRVNMTGKGSPWGYSFWEFAVYGDGNVVSR